MRAHFLWVDQLTAGWNNTNKLRAGHVWAIRSVLQFAALFTLSFASIGCGGGGAGFTDRTPPVGKSLIYIYREGNFVGGANAWELYANKKQITVIGNGGYYDYLADPGHIEFAQMLQMRAIGFLDAAITRSNGPQPIYAFDAEPGHVYYFKIELGGGPGHPKMNQVGKDHAVKEMANLKRFDDVKPAPAH